MDFVGLKMSCSRGISTCSSFSFGFKMAAVAPIIPAIGGMASAAASCASSWGDFGRLFSSSIVRFISRFVSSCSRAILAIFAGSFSIFWR